MPDTAKRIRLEPTTTHLKVTSGDVVLADTQNPVLLHETGCPTRYYLPREDVNFAALTPNSNRTHCPYKGDADQYWDAGELQNVAWAYSAPYDEISDITGNVAFYNEIVDITIDGVLQDRP